VSLAGAQWNDITRCQTTEPVSVLEVHGTADTTVPYAGGNIYGTPFPGALTTVADWKQLNGCSGDLADGGADLDLEMTLAGAETHRAKYGGCPAGGGVELWTMEGGGHIPQFTSEWGPDFWAWLVAHPKP